MVRNAREKRWCEKRAIESGTSPTSHKLLYLLASSGLSMVECLNCAHLGRNGDINSVAMNVGPA